MAGEFTFDSAIVSQCANDISAHQKSIMALVDQASSTASGLAGWEGSASEQFRATFNAMTAKLGDANNVINTYVQFLNDALQKYEVTENDIQTDAASFENGD